MKRLLTLLFVITVALMISSCASIYPNQKKLVGTWKPEKVEKYDIPDLQNTATGAKEKAKPGTEENAPAAAAAQPSKAEGQLARLIENARKSMLTLNADKTAIIEYHGKTIPGTWKLKNHGTRLEANSKETGQKMTLEIIHVNDTSAVVTEALPIGSLKITYKRVRK